MPTTISNNCTVSMQEDLKPTHSQVEVPGCVWNASRWHADGPVLCQPCIHHAIWHPLLQHRWATSYDRTFPFFNPQLSLFCSLCSFSSFLLRSHDTTFFSSFLFLSLSIPQSLSSSLPSVPHIYSTLFSLPPSLSLILRQLPKFWKWARDCMGLLVHNDVCMRNTEPSPTREQKGDTRVSAFAPPPRTLPPNGCHCFHAAATSSHYGTKFSKRASGRAFWWGLAPIFEGYKSREYRTMMVPQNPSWHLRPRHLSSLSPSSIYLSISLPLFTAATIIVPL